jgi:excinuclease UvrABC nuclease subunit
MLAAAKNLEFEQAAKLRDQCWPCVGRRPP